MPYKFELTFTGLIIFTFKGDKRTPDEVNALLVDGAGHHGHDHHYPLLVTDPRNHRVSFPKPPHREIPGPGGELVAHHDITDRALTVSVPGVTLPGLAAEWRPADGTPLGRKPGNDSEEVWLDWAMALQRMNPGTPDPTDEAPHAGLLLGEIARVRLRAGKLTARGFKYRDNGDYAEWDFKVPSSGPVGATHAMAGAVVLSIEDIPDDKHVLLAHGTGLRVILVPARLRDGSTEPMVRASVVNLPQQAVDPHHLPDHLHHFAFFYDMVDFQSGKPPLRLPHPRTAGITLTSSYCPPTTYTKSE